MKVGRASGAGQDQEDYDESLPTGPERQSAPWVLRSSAPVLRSQESGGDFLAREDDASVRQ